MIIPLKVIYSSNAPSERYCVWLKPVEGGFSMYVYDGGWKTLKLANEGNSPYTLSDDKTIDVEEKSPDKFKVVVTSTKEGVTDLELDALKKELYQGIGSELYNLWSNGPIEFDFTKPDDNGRNLTIKANNLELKAGVGIDDSGTTPVVTFGTPSYAQGHPSYKNSFLTTYFSTMLTGITYTIIEDVLDESEETT